MFFLTETGNLKVPFLPPAMHNKGFYLASLNQLTRWMNDYAVGLGIEVAQTSGKIGVDSLKDIALDTAGTLVGWLAWRYWRRRLTTSKDGASDSLGS